MKDKRTSKEILNSILAKIDVILERIDDLREEFTENYPHV